MSSSLRFKRKRHIPWKTLIVAGVAAFAVHHYMEEWHGGPQGSQFNEDFYVSTLEGDVDVPKTLAGSYLTARLALAHFDDNRATQAYTEALRIRPHDPTLLRQAFEAYLLSGEVEKAIALVQEAEDAGKDLSDDARDLLYLPTIRLVEVVNFVKRGQTQEAHALIDTYLQNGRITRFHKHFFRMLDGWLLAEDGDVTAVRQALSHVLGAKGMGPFAQFHAALIYALMDKPDDAKDAFELSLKEAGTMPHRVVELYANFLQHIDDAKAHEKLLTRFWEQNRDVWLEPKEVEAVLSHYDGKNMVPTAKDGIAELLYGSASILYQQGDSSAAYQLLHMALYLQPELEEARIMLGDFLEREERFEEAVAHYEMIPRTSPLYRRASMEKARAMARNNQEEKAVSILKNIASSADASLVPWLHMGDIYRGEEQFARAAEAYKEALQRVDDEHRDSAFLWPIYYMRGICYERTDQWDKAEADFNRAMELSPGNPDVLNYLGYSWLVKGKNLQQAHDMIAEAAQARPHDAHIIDSMGWALVKLGRLHDAKAYLERSIELMPDDATVNDHLGDLYWKLGRKREARFQWERALIFDPDDKQKASLRQKLEHGLQEDDKTEQARQQ